MNEHPTSGEDDPTPGPVAPRPPVWLSGSLQDMYVDIWGPRTCKARPSGRG